MAEDISRALGISPHVKGIEIEVNGKPVIVEGKEQTGKSIKTAAVAQGVHLKLDFELFVLHGHEREHVADDEEIEVHRDERFVAEVPKDIDVLVNEKPVVLSGRAQTGLSIKEAAVAQDVPIQLDFVLSIELGGGRTNLVGDDEKIKVHEHERFLAIPNDDNS